MAAGALEQIESEQLRVLWYGEKSAKLARKCRRLAWIPLKFRKSAVFK